MRPLLLLIVLLLSVPNVQAESVWLQLIPEETRKQQLEIMRNPVSHSLPIKARQLRNAQVNPLMNEQSITIPGYLVPLEMEGERFTEMLLVPYFGACMHLPPPPANQIVHFEYPQGLENFEYDAPYQVTGTLKTEFQNLAGEIEVGYSLVDAKIEPYQPDR